MPDVPRYYWDACLWIELITQSQPDRVKRLMHVLDLVSDNKAELWTSTFTLAEVWKRKCEGAQVGITEERDRAFEDYIEKEFIKKVQLDVDVGMLARRLLRKHPSLGKPQDAVHVASALLSNVDEFHTFDAKDLLPLDRTLPRLDRKKLIICEPPLPPEDPQSAMDLDPDDDLKGSW